VANRELFVGTDENGNLMSMDSEGRVVPANTRQLETPRSLVLKRAAEFIQQMTQQTIRHEEAREQLVSRLGNWHEPREIIMWSQSIKELAEADRQLAEGVAMVINAVDGVTPDDIKPKPKVKLTDYAGWSKEEIRREFGLDEPDEGVMADGPVADLFTQTGKMQF
jgi:hypothetical protein